eukprot:scaffold5386_cov98-Isochrysis_galbana.AAC.6
MPASTGAAGRPCLARDGPVPRTSPSYAGSTHSRCAGWCSSGLEHHQGQLLPDKRTNVPPVLQAVNSATRGRWGAAPPKPHDAVRTRRSGRSRAQANSSSPTPPPRCTAPPPRETAEQRRQYFSHPSASLRRRIR